jgi:hypothetical protein
VPAQLTTSQLNQNGLTVSGNGRVTCLRVDRPMSLPRPKPDRHADLADNDLVIQSTAAAKPRC